MGQNFVVNINRFCFIYQPPEEPGSRGIHLVSQTLNVVNGVLQADDGHQTILCIESAGPRRETSVLFILENERGFLYTLKNTPEKRYRISASWTSSRRGKGG